MLNVLNMPATAAVRHAPIPDARPGVDPQGWTLSTLIAIVLRRAKLVIAVACLVVALAALYLMLASPRFTATVTLIPDTKRTPPAPTEAAQDATVDPAIVESQIETIKSERIALAVIDKLGLTQDPEFIGEGPSFLDRAISALFGSERPPAGEDVKRRVAAASFGSMLKVLRVGRSYVAEISFTSKDPVKAATIANEIAEAYIQDQLGAKFASAQRSGRWMQQHIAELRHQAAEAAAAIETYKAANGLELDSEGKSPVEREHQQLAASLEQAKADTAQARARAERVQAVLRAEDGRTALPDSGFLDALDNASVARLRENYRDLVRQGPAQPLENRGSAPDDPGRAAQLAQNRDAIWDEVHKIAEAEKVALEAALLREATITRRLNELAPQVAAMQRHLDTVRELENKQRGYQQLYEALHNRFARVSQFVQHQSLPVTEARVVTEATPPLRKSSPKTALVLLLSVFAGGTLGIGGALGREYFDRKIRRPQQIEEELGARVLGQTPRFGKARPPKLKRNHSVALAAERTDAATPRPNDSWLARRINGWLSGPAGETLRGVRVAIDETVQTPHARVIAVVSPRAGEGKSTIALSLAVLAARSGKRTLLIDGDLREPTLTRALSPGLTGGLVAALAQRSGFAERAVRHELGFNFLGQPPGFSEAHPSDVLGSDAMQDLLERERLAYDYVIVDTPPLLRHVDVAASAGLFDAFVGIAEWGRTTIEDAARAFGSTNLIADRLVGVLINKSKAERVA